MSEYADLLKSTHVLAREMERLQAVAVAQYTPAVNALIATGSRDARQIEWTLDGLLAFCGHGPALDLYRNLCRHYFAIDPVATVDYINAYRKMWDSSEEGEETWKRV